MKCALCDDKGCFEGKDCTDIRMEIEKKYSEEDLKSIKISAHIEAKFYMKKTRIEELILYARDMGYKRLGIAFCIGLEEEAKIIHQILEKTFEVYSVCCKVCGINKSKFNLEHLSDDLNMTEAMCNSIGQAIILNKEKTDLNIIVGLCIGDDTIFTKYSDAPVTTLAVKDRVLAHNPLGAIYSKYYYEKFKEENSTLNLSNTKKHRKR